MQFRRRRARPVITLTTDFGLEDAYVAEMKAAILRRCREAVIVDVTHAIPAQDLVRGSIVLERAVASFAAGTVHLAVVDPGVGTERRMLVARLRGSLIVCPDNGLITWAVRRHGRARFFELLWRPGEFSHTFHGRDVMAPAAAMLAMGVPLARLGRPMADAVMLDLELPGRNGADGRVIFIDRFGNATTNLVAEGAGRLVRLGRQEIGPIRRTYADVNPRQPLALIGSSGLVEIAVREGSAAKQLGIAVGDRVELH